MKAQGWLYGVLYRAGSALEHPRILHLIMLT